MTTAERITELERQNEGLRKALREVYSAFSIGEQARSPGILMSNLRNVIRFTEMLHAIEREFFRVPGEPDEDFPDEEPQDECLVNSWGSTVPEYVEQFRAALERYRTPAHAQHQHSSSCNCGADRTAAVGGQSTQAFDFHSHLARQAAWSEKTFGPGMRTAGVCDHIRKELLEIEAEPWDLREWIDVVILGLDGAWRCGGTPAQIIDGIVAKQTKNESRTWPDWRTADPNKAIEHDRSADSHAATTAAHQEGGA